MCEDGDFRCIRTGCTAWVDSNDCEDDEDEDGHAYALGAAAKLEALAQSGPKEWTAPDEATRGRIVGLLAQIQKAAAKSSAPEDRAYAERVLGQQLALIDPRNARTLAELMKQPLLLGGNDAGHGTTFVKRLQDAPHVWRTLVDAACVAWRLSPAEALELFEAAGSTDISSVKYPTVGTIRPDSRALLLRLAFAAMEQTPSAEGAPPSALRVLLSGWLNSRLVQLGLDYRAMTVTHNGGDAMDDGASTGDLIRRVEVVGTAGDGQFKVLATFVLAVGGHQGGRGRGSTDGDVEVYATMLRALFDGEVPPEAPTLQIDVDALLADSASWTVDVDEDYMEGFERFE
jgi:hypothetical protein